MNIKQIEALTIEEVMQIALETEKIKGYTVFFVDLKDRFGYSALVFKSNKQIHYVNEYQLHYSETDTKILKEKFVDTLNKKLYTLEELKTVASYADYKNKMHYLRNYHIQEFDHVSIFGIGKTLEAPEDWIYNPVSFCYCPEEIVETEKSALETLKKAFEELLQDDEVFRKMIRYELANHEACITCRYDDTLSDLGLKFEELPEHRQKIVIAELKKQIQNYDY